MNDQEWEARYYRLLQIHAELVQERRTRNLRITLILLALANLAFAGVVWYAAKR